MRKLTLILLVLSLLLTLLSGCSKEPGTSSFEDQNLMFAGDYRSLLKLIGEQKADGRQYGIEMTGAPGAAAEDSADGAGSGEMNNAGYSRTNLQVEGVDEADIIKTDGRYIYLINNGRLTIVDAANPADLRMASELSWASYETMASGSRGESPQELFIDSENQRLILLLSGYEQEISEVDGSDMTGATTAPGTDGGGSGSDGIETAVPDTDDGSGPVDLPAPDVIYVTRYRDYVTTIVFDISEPAAPAEVSRLSQEGSYLTSRRIGSSVYVVSQTAAFWMMDMGRTASTEMDTLPETRVNDGEWKTVPVDSIGVVPGRSRDSQLTISAFTSDGSSGDPKVISLLGTTGQVYASSTHLYVAAWQWNESNDPSSPPVESTMMYRFALRPGQIEAASSVSVPGSVLNQFSMDEHNGYLRVATTMQSAWNEKGEFTGSSQLHVYDQALRPVGSVSGIAPGEMIKSARFMGDMAYLVTFETVDPLFVIDLSQPQNPTILGELKIPGYSTYLHPYNDNMLLGFGYDVDASGDRLTQLGLKVSLFDISDVSRPREHSTITLGGSGSYSELLYNHKSLLFDRERRMIAFPVSLMPESDVDDGREIAYMPDFTGLMILTADANDNLSEMGRISHGSTDDFWYYDQMQRAITIGDTLYTTSSRMIRSHQMPGFAELGRLELPGYQKPTDDMPAEDGAEAPDGTVKPQQ